MNRWLKRALLTAAAVPLVAGAVSALADEARGGQGIRDEGRERVSVSPSVTRSPAATPRPVADTPVARSSAEDALPALTQLAVEAGWAKTSTADRASLCAGWRTDRYLTLEAFMESAEAAASGYSLDGTTVMRFFDGRCGTNR